MPISIHGYHRDRLTSSSSKPRSHRHVCHVGFSSTRTRCPSPPLCSAFTVGSCPNRSRSPCCRLCCITGFASARIGFQGQTPISPSESGRPTVDRTPLRQAKFTDPKVSVVCLCGELRCPLLALQHRHGTSRSLDSAPISPSFAASGSSVTVSLALAPTPPRFMLASVRPAALGVEGTDRQPCPSSDLLLPTSP